ncbi:MAG TPA: hypothetical protein VJH03_17700 [Blastocatellia bacterium]|nr:hypothetical protein [Blastocatellia bacterium]
MAERIVINTGPLIALARMDVLDVPGQNDGKKTSPDQSISTIGSSLSLLDELNLPKKFLRPILPSPRELVTDEILADEHGEPHIASRRYILSCDLPEREVESDYPMLWRYLLRGMERRVNEGYGEANEAERMSVSIHPTTSPKPPLVCQARAPLSSASVVHS